MVLVPLNLPAPIPSKQPATLPALKSPLCTPPGTPPALSAQQRKKGEHSRSPRGQQPLLYVSNLPVHFGDILEPQGDSGAGW